MEGEGPPPACLTEDQIERLVRGRLPAPSRAEAQRHVDGCARCRRLVADAARFAADAEDDPATMLIGSPASAPRALATIGRYVVGEPIGAGGGGVIYAAHDPHLKRAVALKLVQTPVGGDPASMLREAQAMARLAHPNVVNVHDAGVHDGQTYIVMELIEGTSMSRWLRDRPRVWPEILRVFADAGRGLAAAHAAGLVHRDFKPENVLVGHDGRARVTDFGLARPTNAPPPPDVELAAAHSSPANVTTLAGTPGFLAPELLRGAAPTALSDQFAYCVALHLALTGRHPARTPKAGEDGVVPARLRTVLERGLAVEPERRFPSMDALVDAIEQARSGGHARSRILVGAAVVAAALVIAAVLVARRSGTGPSSIAVVPPDPCGNGVVDPGEECDDGNRVEDDGCTSRCLRCEGGDARLVGADSGHCYLRHDRAAPWGAAASTCRAAGGHLLALETLAEMDALSRGLRSPGGADLWVGLYDPRRTATYSWITRAPRLPAFANLPSGGLPRGACAIWRTDGTFELGACGERRAFVCERAPWLRRDATGHAYRVIYGNLTWDTAGRLCESKGARLAVIDDAEERQFLSTTFFGDLWLGASRVAGRETFVWLDGRELPAAAFAVDDPELPSTGRACVALGDDHGLHDRPCDGTAVQHGFLPHAALCELTPSPAGGR